MVPKCYYLAPLLICLIAAPAAKQAGAQEPGWSSIPCAESHVTATPMKSCFVGPIDHGPSGNCTVEHYTASAEDQSQFDLVAANILDKGKSPSCWIAWDNNWTTNIQSIIPRVRRDATGWSNLTQIAGISGLRFELPQRNCFAFYKMGPGYLRGSAYSIRGFVCGATGRRELTSNEVSSFVNSIRVTEPSN